VISKDVGAWDREESVKDSTEALFGAEVEMFLKKGIRDRSFEGCCVGDGGCEDIEDIEDIELSLCVDEDSTELSDPVCESKGASDLGISPKYCSVSLTASSCCTPANATTIRSGRKNVSL
jgi:hypothetical protein